MARLLAFATSRFRARESAELTAHVCGCETCSHYVQSQSSLWDLLDVWEPEPIAMNFDRTLYRRIEQLPPLTLVERISRFWSNISFKPALPLAVATLLLVAGYVFDLPQVQKSLRIGYAPAPAAVPPLAPRPINADQIGKDSEDLQLLYQLDVVKESATDAARAM